MRTPYKFSNTSLHLKTYIKDITLDTLGASIFFGIVYIIVRATVLVIVGGNIHTLEDAMTNLQPGLTIAGLLGVVMLSAITIVNNYKQTIEDASREENQLKECFNAWSKLPVQNQRYMIDNGYITFVGETSSLSTPTEVKTYCSMPESWTR